MQVKIIVSGEYPHVWEGDLAEAPVTTIIPEGIVSARTTEEATRLRASIRRDLETHAAVEISSMRWHLRVEREVEA